MMLQALEKEHESLCARSHGPKTVPCDVVFKALALPAVAAGLISVGRRKPTGRLGNTSLVRI